MNATCSSRWEPSGRGVPAQSTMGEAPRTFVSRLAACFVALAIAWTCAEEIAWRTCSYSSASKVGPANAGWLVSLAHTAVVATNSHWCTGARRSATSARCRLRGCGGAALGWPSASVLERTRPGRAPRTAACDHIAEGGLAATSRTRGVGRSRKPRRLGEAVESNEATSAVGPVRGFKWVNLTKLESKDLLKGKKVGVLGDSLSGQVFIHVLSSLQKHGLGDYASCGNITYFYNLKVGDSEEEMFAKGTSQERRNETFSTWTQQAVLGGPFENATWAYWRGVVKWLQPALVVAGSTLRGYLDRRDCCGHITSSQVNTTGMASTCIHHIHYAFCEYDFIVMNLGMHYHNFMVKGLRHDLNTVADLLAAFNKQKDRVGFFRETFPQHFFSVTSLGNFPHPEGYPANISLYSSKCLPAPRVHQWRNDVLWEAAMQKSVPVQHVFHQMDMHGFHTETPPGIRATCGFGHAGLDIRIYKGKYLDEQEALKISCRSMRKVTLLVIHLSYHVHQTTQTVASQRLWRNLLQLYGYTQTADECQRRTKQNA
eukprot:SM000186S04140  [mRNA]  locus=s186:98628:101525:+ [translate_table: standard]